MFKGTESQAYIADIQIMSERIKQLKDAELIMLLRHRRVPQQFIPYVQTLLVILQNKTELPSDVVMHDSIRQGVKNKMIAYECTHMSNDVYHFVRAKERDETFTDHIEHEVTNK